MTNKMHNEIRKWAVDFNAWRVFPRIFFSLYCYLVYEVTVWYMMLPTPTTQQAALMTTVVGGAVAAFTAYTTTGNGPAPPYLDQ